LNIVLIDYTREKVLEMKPDYDVIMIGTGIGGSACAGLLAAAGFKTLVYEKNERVGGMSSSYEKEGFILDSAIHVFSSGIRGRFGKIMKRIGLDTLKFTNIGDRNALKGLDQKGYTSLSFSQEAFQSKAGPKSKAPGQMDFSGMGIRGEDMKVLVTIIGNILQASRKKLREMHDVKLTFEDYIAQFSPNSGVKSFLVFLTGGMFGLPPRMASAPELIQGLQEWIVTNDISYPLSFKIGEKKVGGAITVPTAFLQGVTKYGGEIRMQAKVSKILIEDGKAIGVEVDGTPIYSKIVISNAGIKPTVLNLAGKNYFTKEYVEKVEGLISSFSAVTFKFALKEPIIDHFVFVNLYHGDLSVLGEKVIKRDGPKPTGFMTILPTNADPTLAPPGHQIAIFGTLAPTHSKDWKQWTDYYYNEILKFYPDIEKKMLFCDITTPLDMQTLSGKTFGPIETTALTPDQSGPYRISAELPIENLYVVGDSAGTDTHGIGTQLAADSALKLADLIINKYKTA
jgi:prolycopene isomerase